MKGSALRKNFKKGSRTFYSSALFFPAAVRREVATLYAFLRKADDLVDTMPQDAAAFIAFRDEYRRALAGEEARDPVIKGFLELARRRNFDPGWTEAFLGAMELDLSRREYDSEAEFLEYSYGSAEVIGFFMVAIMELPRKALEPAAILGRSFQLINVLRDVSEDNGLGRRYLWLGDSGLESLQQQECLRKRETFVALMRERVALYLQWKKEAERGYRYIPFRPLLAVKTASDLYGWTARRIRANPLLVFERKLKPGRAVLLAVLLKNFFAVCYHKRCKKSSTPKENF